MKDSKRKTKQKWLEYQKEYYKTNRERILAASAARREALKQKAQKEEELLQNLMKDNSTIAMIEAWNERLRQRIQEVEEQWLIYALQQQIIFNETYAKHLETLGKHEKTNED